MAIDLTQLSEIQVRIWKDSESGTAYTWDQIVELAKEFDGDATAQVPASQIIPKECVAGELTGLIDYGYFVYSLAGGLDEDDLDDWRFTRVDSPSPGTPPQTPTFRIPFKIQGEQRTGNADGTY